MTSVNQGTEDEPGPEPDRGVPGPRSIACPSSDAFAGTGVGTQGSFTYFGTWLISDNGDYCFDRKSNDWPWSMKGCENWYRLGADYFAVRGGVLQKRAVRRI